MGEARFTFTENDLVAAQRAWWSGSARWQTFVKGAAAIGVVYAAIALAASWESSWPDRLEAMGVALSIAVAVMIALLLIGYLLTPRRARRAFREHKALAGEFACEWDADGMTIAHERGTTKMPWAVFHQWMIGPRTLMLFQTSILFNAMPLRALHPGDAEQIVGHLRAAQVPERKRFGFLSWHPTETADGR